MELLQIGNDNKNYIDEMTLCLMTELTRMLSMI